MQFKTRENSEKPNFGPDFCPNLGPKSFFREFYFYIVASYHCMQFQRKLINKTSENGEKHHFGHDLGLLDLNSGRGYFFQKSSFFSH